MKWAMINFYIGLFVLFLLIPVSYELIKGKRSSDLTQNEICEIYSSYLSYERKKLSRENKDAKIYVYDKISKPLHITRKGEIAPKYHTNIKHLSDCKHQLLLRNIILVKFRDDVHYNIQLKFPTFYKSAQVVVFESAFVKSGWAEYGINVHVKFINGNWIFQETLNTWIS